jgi:hypothetical protein
MAARMMLLPRLARRSPLAVIPQWGREGDGRCRPAGLAHRGSGRRRSGWSRSLVSGGVDGAAWADASVVEVSAKQTAPVITGDSVAVWPSAAKQTPAWP